MPRTGEPAPRRYCVPPLIRHAFGVPPSPRGRLFSVPAGFFIEFAAQALQPGGRGVPRPYTQQPTPEPLQPEDMDNAQTSQSHDGPGENDPQAHGQGGTLDAHIQKGSPQGPGPGTGQYLSSVIIQKICLTNKQGGRAHIRLSRLVYRQSVRGRMADVPFTVHLILLKHLFTQTDSPSYKACPLAG